MIPGLRPHSRGSFFGVRLRLIRGLHVVIDADLAHLYGVKTAQLNRAARRNAERFPPDFALRLDDDESRLVRPVRGGRGGTRHRPWAYTAQGALALAAVLGAPGAVRVGAQAARILAAARAARAA